MVSARFDPVRTGYCSSITKERSSSFTHLERKHSKRPTMKLNTRFVNKRNGGGRMTKWNALKTELNLPHEAVVLAKVKLELSELIYDLRTSKKMSQKELAGAIGVSQPYIAKIEDGEENLTLETIVKLLSALNVCLRLKPEKLGKRDSVLHILKKAA